MFEAFLYYLSYAVIISIIAICCAVEGSDEREFIDSEIPQQEEKLLL